MYTANNNSLPLAYIANGRNRMKIYSGKEVFLNNGDEFSIELFNPTQKAVGVKIHINGICISSSLIVLKPGERSFLERYIDSDNKFVFGTYEVDGSEQTKKAIQNNGSIRIEFFNEKTYYPTTLPYQGSYFFPSGTITTAIGISNFTTTGGEMYGNSGDSHTCYFSNSLSDSRSRSVETGRVERGEQSGQVFGTYHGEFESYYFTSIEYKIMPASQKPIEIQSLRKYCGECGTRIKKDSFKFCPNCGTKI